MALIDTTWYANAGNQTSTGYYAVPVWTTGAKTAGQIVRQVAPAAFSERLFVCIIAGTSGAIEPTWVLTRGAKTVDGGVTWMECSGQAALCGDLVHATTTAQTRGIAAVLGQVIYDVTSGSVQICTTAGNTAAGTPPFGSTAGVTQLDSTATWTCLGLASAFAAWANPHARITNTIQATWGGVAGNTIYVANTSQELSSTVDPAWPNLGAMYNNPIKVLCVNVAGSMPPTAADLTTGALVATTTGGTIRFNTQGSYAYGIEFRVGNVNYTVSALIGYFTNVAAQNAGYQIFKNCRFTVGCTSINSSWWFGQTPATVGGYLEFEDCQIGVNNAAQTFVQGLGPARFIWRNPSGIAGATGITGGVPQFALFAVAGPAKTVDGLIEGVDLSALSGALIRTPATAGSGNWIFKDCAVRGGTGPYVASGIGPQVDYMRCDSAGTNYQYQRGQYQGQLYTETSIVRSGGAAVHGTPISWKIVTSANSIWSNPFRTAQVIVPNYVVGSSKVVTVYGTINAPGLPNNDEIWVEVCYLGSAIGPVGSVRHSTKANILATGIPVSTDGSTWGGGGSGVGWTPFALPITLSSPNIGMQGTVYVRVNVAKASTTYYIDPQPVIS